MKPFRILICILSTFIVLAAVCVLFSGQSELVRIPTLESVLGLPFGQPGQSELADFSDFSESSELSEPSDSLESSGASEPEDTLVAVDTVSVRPKVVVLPPSLPQTALNLPLFYTALTSADRQSVRVVHFGDSQIEEDRISMVLRRRLQDRFGGGGIGLLPMVQTIPTYTAKQTLEQNGHEVPYTTVRRFLSYGPSAMRMKDGNRYGPMAQVANVTQPVDVTVELLRDRIPTYDYDRIRILCSDSVSVTLLPDSLQLRHILIGASVADTVSATDPMRQEIIVLQEPRRSSMLHFDGKGYVYGISLETATGVQVDNIPMRGASGTNFTLMDRQPFDAYFSHTNTALVIMQFGGNALPAVRSQFAVEKYVQSMRQQIRFVMAAAPAASLLFIGPSDMITTVDGEQKTYPLLPLLDRLLADMVEEEGGAYYSLFKLMGGAGSMFSWRDKGLAGEDMIHFTRAGAKKVGEMLAKQILEDYDRIVETEKSKVQGTDTLNDRRVNDKMEMTE